MRRLEAEQASTPVLTVTTRKGEIRAPPAPGTAQRSGSRRVRPAGPRRRLAAADEESWGPPVVRRPPRWRRGAAGLRTVQVGSGYGARIDGRGYSSGGSTETHARRGAARGCPTGAAGAGRSTGYPRPFERVRAERSWRLTCRDRVDRTAGAHVRAGAGSRRVTRVAGVQPQTEPASPGSMSCVRRGRLGSGLPRPQRDASADGLRNAQAPDRFGVGSAVLG